jgi:hypothetical protein
MLDALFRAMASFRRAIERGDPEAICKAPRVVYTLAVEAALTQDGRWPFRRRSLEKLYVHAINCAGLRDCAEKRYLRNVQARYEELKPLLGTVEPTALKLAGLSP